MPAPAGTRPARTGEPPVPTPWPPLGGAGTLLARHALPRDAIERESLARLRVRLGASAPRDPVALRMLYASGDPTLAPDVDVTPDLVAVAAAALRRAVAIVCDGRLVLAGLDRRRARRLGCALLCAVDAPAVRRAARAGGLTRAALAMAHLADAIDGALVAVGTSPTALLALLDLVAAGRCRPAAVVATPVGLVAAAEAKEALRRSGLPHATVRGSRGGSPLAAAAVNVLLATAAGPEGTG